MSKDIIGLKFGKLTVIKDSGTKTKHGVKLWECLCECGNTKLAGHSQLKRSTNISCGCARFDTKEVFINKARAIHGDKYNYDKVEYKHSQVKVTITCPKHGDFSTTPSVHLGGHACRKCSFEVSGDKSKVELAEFLLRAYKVYGSKYDYSLITPEIFKGVSHRYTFVCPDHGKFTQMADAHMRGKVGCKSCLGKVHDFETFVKAAKAVHGDLYDYSKVNFVKTKAKVEIVCKKHGPFMQTPHNHTAGKHGCPTCGNRGFDRNLPASIYIMEFEDIVKVGVTNRTANQRAINLRCNARRPFKVVKEYSNLDGNLCWDVEEAIHNELRSKYRQVEEKFDGSTECFYDVDKAWLINTLEAKISNYWRINDRAN